MRLRMLIKWGTLISVLLFCLALGYYAFMRLDLTERNRQVNLFSLVPSDCVGVLETDDVNVLLGDYLLPNYSAELDHLRFPGLFDFVLNGLKEYTSDADHGLGHQLGHLLVSFHEPTVSQEQVIYLRMNAADKDMLLDMFQEYMPSNFLPKEEEYRGKEIRVYPLDNNEFLVSYAEDGFIALSFQKRLIEKVIDAELDHTSLKDEEVFSHVSEKKKKRNFLCLYTRNSSMPFLELEHECWNEYEFHMTSDVLYLTGEMYSMDDCSCVESVKQYMKDVPLFREEQMIVSADKDSTLYYMQQAFDANETGERTLFNECVANLSQEALFTFVTDMEMVGEHPERYENYLPSFVMENAPLFSHFILSVQLMANEVRPSHIWVFTYKD